MKRFILLLIPGLIFSCASGPTKETKLLVGYWKVVSSNILPFEHPSFCEKLSLNSLFVFNVNNQVKVFISDSTLDNCNNHQSFSVDSSKIDFLEGDMVFSYDIVKLTNDSLIFHNPFIPKYLFKDPLQTSKKDSIIEVIRREGVVVKLIRLNNGR